MDTLLERIANRGELFAILDRNYTKHILQPSLKCVVVLTEMNPETLQRLGKGSLLRKYEFKVERLDSDVYRIHAQKSFKFDKSEALFIVLVGKGYWVILTREKKNITEGLIEGFLNALYPMVIRPYLNNLQLAKLMLQTSQAYLGELDVRFMAYTEEDEKQLREVSVRGEHLKPSENIVHLNRIEFIVKEKQGYIPLKSVVTTRGFARLVYGSFSEFHQKFLLSMVELAMNWDDKYLEVKRSYGEEGPLLTSCVISYAKPPTKDDLRKLSKKITSKYTAVVAHAGNPFFLAQVSDSSNRSSFAMTLYGDKLSIVPITTKSNRPSASVWKLTETVQDVLGEGEISVA